MNSEELDKLFKDGRIHPLTYKYIKSYKGSLNVDHLIKVKKEMECEPDVDDSTD